MSTYKVFSLRITARTALTFVVARRTIEQPGRVPMREWVLVEVDEFNNGKYNGKTYPLVHAARTRSAVEDLLVLAGYRVAREVQL